MELPIYNQTGKKTGTATLPAALFGRRWNSDLVHQVITAMQSNARSNTAHTKGRGEVRGGGKKPWRQKGTGRARHGSTRSPIWRGGGITHGPTNERNYDKKINKEMKRQAFLALLSRKAADGEIVLLDQLDLKTPKTKMASEIVAALAKASSQPELSYRRGKRTLFALTGNQTAAVKSFRNLPQVKVEEVRTLSPLDILTYRYLVVVNPEVSLAALADRLAATK